MEVKSKRNLLLCQGETCWYRGKQLIPLFLRKPSGYKVLFINNKKNLKKTKSFITITRGDLQEQHKRISQVRVFGFFNSNMLLGLKHIQTFTYGVCFGCINTHTNTLNSTHIFTGYSTY